MPLPLVPAQRLPVLLSDTTLRMLPVASVICVVVSIAPLCAMRATTRGLAVPAIAATPGAALYPPIKKFVPSNVRNPSAVELPATVHGWLAPDTAVGSGISGCSREPSAGEVSRRNAAVEPL